MGSLRRGHDNPVQASACAGLLVGTGQGEHRGPTDSVNTMASTKWPDFSVSQLKVSAFGSMTPCVGQQRVPRRRKSHIMKRKNTKKSKKKLNVAIKGVQKLSPAELKGVAGGTRPSAGCMGE